MKSAGIGIALLVGLLTTASFGQGTVLWDENVNGPLSNDWHYPTLLGGLSIGTNSIGGAAGVVLAGNGGTIYEDFFSFSVPSGSDLKNIGFASDKPVYVVISLPNFSQPIASVDDPSSGELLTQLHLPNLAAGDYGMFLGINKFDVTGEAIYRLDFVVQTVPEPSAWVFSLLGAAGWFLQNRWRETRCKEQT